MLRKKIVHIIDAGYTVIVKMKCKFSFHLIPSSSTLEERRLVFARHYKLANEITVQSCLVETTLKSYFVKRVPESLQLYLSPNVYI